MNQLNTANMKKIQKQSIPEKKEMKKIWGKLKNIVNSIDFTPKKLNKLSINHIQCKKKKIKLKRIKSFLFFQNV